MQAAVFGTIPAALISNCSLSGYIEQSHIPNSIHILLFHVYVAYINIL